MGLKKNLTQNELATHQSEMLGHVKDFFQDLVHVLFPQLL